MYLQNLKKIRLEQNYTQAQIAERLKTSQQHYAKYENGKVEPTAGRIVELCKIFNVSADYLLGIQHANDK